MALCVAALAAAAPSTADAAPCPVQASTHVFERWGDTAAYYLLAGGRFEGSLTWSKVGSPVLVTQNNPFQLSGLGSRSVRLRGWEAVLSPTFCVDAAHPHVRFVTRAMDRSSRLVTEVLWNDRGTWRLTDLDEHVANSYQAWGPSKIVGLLNALPTANGQSHQVRLVFRLKDGFGEWLVDDVFVDPSKRV